MKRSFYALLLTMFLTLSNLAFSFQEDAKVNEAIRYALSEKWYDAFQSARASSDPKFAENAVQAIKIYNSPASIDVLDLKKFFTNNRWIPVDAYATKIEKSISFEQNSENLIEWFKFNPPVTNQGKFLELHAQLNKGIKSIRDPKTKDLLRKLWRTTEFDTSSEEYYIKKYKEHFTVEDLLKKIEHLTWRRSFDMSEKLIAILPKKYQMDCIARLKIARNPDKINRILPSSSEKIKRDEIVSYYYIDYLLKAKQDDKALARLINLKTTQSPDKWWKLRSIAIRNAMRDKSYKAAYKLASEHGIEEGVDFAEAEWLSGWIALRFLEDAEIAKGHFENMHNKVKLANSKSKAAYWIARSYEALEMEPYAKEWFENASKYPATFYGQLAIAKVHGHEKITYLQEKAKNLDEENPPKDHQAAKKITLFAYYLFKSGNKSLAYNIIESLATIDISRHEIEQVAAFFAKRGFYPLTVQLSKAAANKSSLVISEGYPRHIQISNNALPKPIYLAIIRQESNFDSKAESPAGAKGLMQIMPSTGELLAKSLGLPKYGYATDPKLNIMKGVSYFDNLYSDNHSFIMSIASYNAGPGNVKKWIARNGDLRKFKTIEEKIDWIEQIPFSETRNYVKKVIENMVIYNSLLSPKHTASTIEQILDN